MRYFKLINHEEYNNILPFGLKWAAFYHKKTETIIFAVDESIEFSSVIKERLTVNCKPVNEPTKKDYLGGEFRLQCHHNITKEGFAYYFPELLIDTN